MSFRSCHKLVRSIAQAAAGELYERVMKDNVVRAEFRRQNPGLPDRALEKRFIAQFWGKMIPMARGTMATMLGRSDIADSMKTEIYEALQLDASLVPGRYEPEEAVEIVNAEILRRNGVSVH